MLSLMKAIRSRSIVRHVSLLLVMCALTAMPVNLIPATVHAQCVNRGNSSLSINDIISAVDAIAYNDFQNNRFVRLTFTLSGSHTLDCNFVDCNGRHDGIVIRDGLTTNMCDKLEFTCPFLVFDVSPCNLGTSLDAWFTVRYQEFGSTPKREEAHVLIPTSMYSTFTHTDLTSNLSD